MQTKIQRRSFNQGELDPRLHYRSDLEAYYSGCKTMKNMIVTPWGAATRRPPTRRIAEIDDERFGTAVAYIPFRYSDTNYYHLVVTDNQGTANPWNPKFVNTNYRNPLSDLYIGNHPYGIIILDNEGNLVRVWGDNWRNDELRPDPEDDFDPYFLTTFWGSDVGADDLVYSNVNDVIYVTIKNSKYPLAQIYRFQYENGEDYWAFDPHVVNGGPFMDENVDEDNKVIIFDNDQNYNQNFDNLDDLVKHPTSRTKQWLPVYAQNEGGMINSISEGANTYLLNFQKMPPLGSKLLGSIFRVRLNSDDFSLNWSDQTSRSKNFFSGEFNTKASINDIGVEFYDPETMRPPHVSDPSWKKQLTEKEYSACVGNAVPAQGVVRLKTTGVWAGTLVLEETRDGINYKVLGSIESENGNNNEIIEREVTGIEYSVRVRMARASKVKPDVEDQEILDEGCFWTLEPSSSYAYFNVVEKFDDYNYVAIGMNECWGREGDRELPQYWTREFTDNSIWTTRKGSFSYLWHGLTTSSDDGKDDQFRYISGRDISDIPGNTRVYETSFWSFGGFCEGTGYPRCHTIHNERMCLSGTKANPNTIYASTVNDWTNFEETDSELSAFQFTMQSDTSDGVRWMAAEKGLLVGTATSETIITGASGKGGFSATNIMVEPQTHFGSAPIQPAKAANTLFFVEEGGRRIRSVVYSLERDKFLASNMSLLSDHLFNDTFFHAIRRIDFTRNPDTALIALRADGTLAYFVYDEEQKVAGWSWVELGGPGPRNGGKADVVDFGTNNGPYGDSVYFIVDRSTAVPKHALEVMDPVGSILQFGSNSGERNVTFLDSQSTILDSTGKERYQDTDLHVVEHYTERRLPRSEYTLSGGKVTIKNSTGGAYSVGYGIDVTLEPTDMVKPYDFGPIRSTPMLNLYLYQSSFPNIYVNGHKTDSQYYRGDSDKYNTGTNQDGDPVFGQDIESTGYEFYPANGPYKITANPGYKESISMRFESSNHLPLTILAVGLDQPNVGDE